jgi:paired amphipathic helix protein Sin3a
MDVRRPPMGGDGRREHDISDRPSDPQIHQPVALAPTIRTVHGPDGLLAGQGPALPPPGAPHMAAPISQQSQQPPSQGFPQLPPPPGAQIMPGQAPQPILPPFGQPAQPAQPLNPTQQPILNDALSYLDQVKNQFQAHPDVYNKFLDIMKEFKSGAYVDRHSSSTLNTNRRSIDTPGVIERVSQLFAGHPNLIQGFNTFLPPGYKIECGMGDDPNSIRVTTPSGTTQSVLPARPLSARPYGPSLQPPPLHFAEPNGPGWQQPQPQQPRGAHELGYQDGRLPPQIAFAHAGAAPPPGPGMVMGADALRDQSGNVGHPDQRTLPPPPQMPQGMSRSAQAAVSAAESQILGMVPVNGAGAMIPGGPGADKRAPVEFNHAINYVNKIKNRFASQPDIYKQFLEILQTYQRESKPIGDVYSQVTRLFDSAPDLLEDFKQFLPESAAHANAVARANEAFPLSNTRTDPGYQALAQASAQHTPRAESSRLPPMGSFAPTPSSSRDKRKRGEKAGPGAVEQVVLGRPGLPASGHVAKVS